MTGTVADGADAQHRHIALVIGTRPEVVQAHPIVVAANLRGTPLRVVTISQHTDPLMSTAVLPPTMTSVWNTESVEVAPFSLGAALTAVQQHFAATNPAAVIVIGDTDSSLAGALAATELRIPVVHVESGLRSHDWAMKEERNRVLIDHLSAVCCPPVTRAAEQLRREQVHGQIVVTGDVHVDAMRLLAEAGELANAPDGAGDGTLLCTLHRRENILDRGRLGHLVDLLTSSAQPIRFALHPHTRLRLEEYGQLARLEASETVELGKPLPFLQFVSALSTCSGVVTDSGGVQKQAYLLGRPCLTLRTTTEWDETLEGGWNQLIDPSTIETLPLLTRPTAAQTSPFGGGYAGDQILAATEALLTRPR
jgi:UDP-N-acetylglucosamine 2-epimerase